MAREDNRADREPTVSEPLVFQTQPQRFLKLVLMAGGFVALGAFILYVGSGWERLVGWACVIVFGAAGVYFLLRLARPQPCLIVDAEGLVDNGSALAAGRLAWQDIRRIAVVEQQLPHGNRMEYIGVWPRDEEAFLAGQARLKRKAMLTNMGMGMPAVLIPSVMLCEPPDEILYQITAYYRQLEAGGIYDGPPVAMEEGVLP